MASEHTQLSVALTVDQLWQRTPGGPATYVLELARALAARDDVALSGLTAARHLSRRAVDLPASIPLVRSADPRARESTSHTLWRRTGTGDSRTAPDVLHATTWAIPPKTAPLVVTIHDLAVLRDPEPAGSPGDFALLRALDAVRDEADVVVVPSAATAADCIEHGIEPVRIHIIPHGVRVPAVARSEMLHFLESRGLDRQYVMWCGTFEARKNLTALLDAYLLLLDEHPDLDLVLVGPVGWGGAPDEVARRVANVPPGRVHLLGRLDETDLYRAYAGARVFCFPSTLEGFGLPVLEALAHGVPVVTATGTAMAEIADSSAVLLVDPHVPDQIAAAMGAAATGRHAELTAGAKALAARFTWERSAGQHMVAYRAALTG